MISSLLAGGFGYFYHSPNLANPPKPTGLYPTPFEVDFDALKQGDTAQAEFVLTNHYDSSVEIREVQAGCSCQEASITKKLLDPGDQAIVTVKWQVGGRRGKVTDSIWVTHSIPGTQEDREAKQLGQLRLKLVADVQPEIAYDPVALTFRFGEPATATIQLKSGCRDRFTIKGVSSNSRCLSVVYFAPTQSVEVRYTPQDELDRGQGLEVLIDTDGEAEPRLHIPVRILQD